MPRGIWGDAHNHLGALIMAQPHFSTDTNSDGITTLTLQRAPVNALSPDFLEALESTFTALVADSACKALVIQSAFKVFSAGMDLAEATGFSAAEEERTARAFTNTFRALYALPKPSVCAVGGAAIAGGFFFPAACDFCISSPAANFGLAEVKVGATLPVGPLEIARAELTPAGFRRLLLSGDPVKAEEAMAIGLVDQIVASEELAAESLAKANSLAALPAAAYAQTKADLRAPALAAIDNAVAGGAHAPGKSWFLPDTREHMRAMMSDRKKA